MIPGSFRSLVWAGIVLCLALTACKTNTVEDQTAALTLTSDDLALRQANSRRFYTSDEPMMQSACAAVLQDLGFTLEESSTETGVLVASKDRDAVEAQQVAAQIFLAAIVAALGGRSDPVWEKNQKIRISIATRPVNSSVVVRATVQRVIWNTKNQLSRIETIEDPQIYMQFFDKLSLAVFLEAHKI